MLLSLCFTSLHSGLHRVPRPAGTHTGTPECGVACVCGMRARQSTVMLRSVGEAHNRSRAPDYPMELKKSGQEARGPARSWRSMIMIWTAPHERWPSERCLSLTLLQVHLSGRRPASQPSKEETVASHFDCAVTPPHILRFTLASLVSLLPGRWWPVWSVRQPASEATQCCRQIGATRSSVGHTHTRRHS